MQNLKALWIVLTVIVVVSFAVLGLIGRQIYVNKPPIPAVVASQSGEVLFTGDDIETGRQVWQSMGGQQLGSIWGHGSYLTPDWSADWLHRELVTILDEWAMQDYGSRYDDLSSERQAALRDRLQTELRNNRVDEETGRARRVRTSVPQRSGPISAITRICSVRRRSLRSCASSMRCRTTRSPIRRGGRR